MTAAADPSPAARAPKSRRAVRTGPLLAPAVGLLLVWMIVPLAMTLWFSLQRYNLLNPFLTGFAGFENYYFLLTDPALAAAIINTIVLVGSVLIVTVVLGTLFAVLFDQDFFGRGVARLLIIAPFFVMPTVSALIWKNLLMHPVNGLMSWVTRSLGLGVIDWFGTWPMTAIVVIVSWQWVPFATLILLTAIQSLDREQVEAARMDGARGIRLFWNITLPHLLRPIAVVVMIETIFLLSIFAEILVTTSGGPGTATTNLTYLIYVRALLEYDVGGASAGGVIAIVLANIVAIFLIRTVARNLDT
jgi:sorbitol/mannitol transport system permease protein